MKRQTFTDLGFAKIDIERKRRCGFDEVVYCPGKTKEQLKKICHSFLSSKRPLVLTRLEKNSFLELKKTFPRLKYNPIARIAFSLSGRSKSSSKNRRHVLIISAGTSDIPVAEEVYITLKALGVAGKRLYDVGVAGIQRLLAHKRKLRRSSCIVIVAGMDAALASIVSGMVKVPVVAVPTSCGYGAHFEGLASLLSMLNSCAAGVAVVNIDNGFGAGILAAKILRTK